MYYLDSPVPDIYLYFNDEWYYWLLTGEWMKSTSNPDTLKHHILADILKLVEEGEFPPEMYGVERFPKIVPMEKLNE